MFNYYSINSQLLLDPRILDRFRQKKKKNEEYWTARYLGTWHAALVSAIRILMGHRWRGMSQIEKDEFTF